jgi:DNA polymerase, archaea type
VHGIVDSMWLKKRDATNAEYSEICEQIEKECEVSIGYEGQYRWIVFLNSKIDANLPVLNRYYGVFEDGTLKLRGIGLRRHDTPEIIRKCQTDMLTVLSEAENSNEFLTLIPKAVDVARGYVSMLRTGKVSIMDLIVENRISKLPNEYAKLVPQAVAAKHLIREGGEVHAGQAISYFLNANKSKVMENRALPVELVDENTPYDLERYVQLLSSSVTDLLLPFGYTSKSLLNELMT